MGVLERLSRVFKRIDDPVRGTAYVVAAGPYRGRGIRSSCPMELVVEADGVPATAVTYKGLAHRNRWPHPGMVLAVTVDRSDPRRFSIDWDALPNSRDAARIRAEQLAALLRGEAADGTGAATTEVRVWVQGRAGGAPPTTQE